MNSKKEHKMPLNLGLVKGRYLKNSAEKCL